VRVALGRQIVQDIAGMSTELPVITLEPDSNNCSRIRSAATTPRRQASSPASQNACSVDSPKRRSDRK
jgi:flagellar biosynthesis component FlhA